MILVTVVEKKIDGYTVGQGKKGERGGRGIVVTDIYISTLVNRVVTLLEKDARIRHQPRENLLTSPPSPRIIISLLSGRVRVAHPVSVMNDLLCR